MRGFTSICKTLGEDSARICETLGEDSQDLQDFGRGFVQVFERLWERIYKDWLRSLGEDLQGFARLCGEDLQGFVRLWERFPRIRETLGERICKDF